MFQNVSVARKAPDEKPEPATPKMSESERELLKLKQDAEKNKTLGTKKDPRLEYIAGLQADAKYVIDFAKADASTKMDLLDQKVKGLEATDARFLKEMTRAQEMMKSPLGKGALSAREEELKASTTAFEAAKKLFAEAEELRGKKDTKGADAKLEEAGALLEKAVKALSPEKKTEPKK